MTKGAGGCPDSYRDVESTGNEPTIGILAVAVIKIFFLIILCI
jgi:hypothetical protein